MNTPTLEQKGVLDRSGSVSYMPYLNGIRGAAALYIVLYHCWIETTFPSYTWINALAPLARFGIELTSYGYLGVDVLIVLSGYCLMLPVARSPVLRLREGIKGFLKRRAQRILPPYYAALLISLLIIAVTPWLNSGTGLSDMLMQPLPPAAPLRSLLAHLFLLHCWRFSWMYTINSPLWTLSVEWQIYFLFAFAILPACRRFGIGKTIVGTFLVTWLPFAIYPRHIFALFCPWLAGLFTLGMAASLISFSPAHLSLRRLPWHRFALACALLVPIIQAFTSQCSFWSGHSRFIYVDPLVGLSFACMLIHMAVRHQKHQQTALMRFFTLPPLTGLGGFSYSLYLTHVWAIALLNIPMYEAGIKPPLHLFILLLVVTPICIAIAYLFHLLFERPFRRRNSV